MAKKLLLLIDSERIYERIVQDVDPEYVSGHIRDINGLRLWLSQNQGAAALVDVKRSDVESIQEILSRFNIPIQYFEGRFNDAEAWIANHLPLCIDERPDTQIAEKDDESETELPPEREDDGAGIQDDLNTTTNTNSVPNPFSDHPPLGVPRKKQKIVLSPFDAPPSLGAPVPSVFPKEPQIEQKSVQSPPATPQPEVKVEVKYIEKYIEVPLEKPVYVTETVPQTLRSKLIVVVNLWPRAGATFFSTVIAHFLSEALIERAVTLIEHPNQHPRLYELFNCQNLHEGEYMHWLEDGRGQVIDYQNVTLIPLKPGYEPPGLRDVSEKLITFTYRGLNRPFTIVDAGCNPDDDLLLDVADHVYLVLDCDPVLLNSEYYLQRYIDLTKSEKVVTVLNKWTKHAQLKNLFPSALYVPYVDPILVARTVWDGDFPTSSKEIAETLQQVKLKVTDPWIPASLKRTQDSSKKSWIWRKGK